MNYLLSRKNYLSLVEILLIISFAFLPLFFSFPYRSNIYLSWEGAYRMYLGQMPYKDFGLPVGYGFWIIPTVFFKIFGPDMITLIKAQAFINIISGFAFISILKSLRIHPVIRFVSVIIYILSFSFFNFWPWYNNTVIVFEFIGLSFLLKYLLPAENRKANYIWLPLSALFIFLSFFTKQDGGGLAFMLCSALLIYHSIIHKTIKPLFLFLLSCIVIALLFILPLLPYQFSYWFNYGQAPHNSRLTISDFLGDLLGNSTWLKFYLLLFLILLTPFFRNYKSWLRNERFMLLILVTFGIWVEATIFQFTSYTPADNNIFFHSFSFMFILTLFYELKIITFKTYKPLIGLSLLVILWWSDVSWKYIDRKIQRFFPASTTTSKENIVSRQTFEIKIDTNNIPQSQWTFSSVPVFKKIYMPPGTVAGIDRLLANPKLNTKNSNQKVLNMTELTPLAEVMGFSLEKGSEQPLWYHLGVGMFNKQKDMYCKRISQNYYDLVLFEYIPNLNNFYPFEVRDSLRKHYQLVDTFMAPRSPSLATIEVYTKKEN